MTDASPFKLPFEVGSMSHEETMQMIINAARMSTASYEEAICIYLRARGILGGAYETLGDAIPDGWVPPRDKVPQSAIRSGPVTTRVREIAASLEKFMVQEIKTRMPDAAPKDIQNSLNYLERTGWLTRKFRGYYETAKS